MKKKIVIGSRDSKLAITQSELVMGQIRKAHPDLELELVTMKTTGDLILDKRLDKIGGKGLFVKELDKALQEGRIDLSVHSLKDLPMEIPEELPLVAFSTREKPYDVLVYPAGDQLVDINLPVGTSSLRRELQLKQLYPNWKVASIRGNLQTRLTKLDRGDFKSIILAYAGMARLKLEDRIGKVFSPDEMIPSAGQGIMVVQGRAGEDYSFLDCVNDKCSEVEALAERAFVRYLEGGCSTPIGAYAEVKGDHILIRGFYYNEKTEECKKDKISGAVQDAERLALELAKQLKGDA
ncbi:hydroxymethylbilane synthase [Clostridium aminobutyricum]|uniref:Porphobilinogen deaminase n=1 Tax=Clostridium aminobutyricum TaxID=33953 RepID=A0A939D6E0_CLOAM|nr:hydroxymethylbilane synthase [Clostridium aminobutyricum]MBN7771906.1 hydroxymethylbilane synthase [Clostridium aminobutyricum]